MKVMNYTGKSLRRIQTGNASLFLKAEKVDEIHFVLYFVVSSIMMDSLQLAQTQWVVSYLEEMQTLRRAGKWLWR